MRPRLGPPQLPVHPRDAGAVYLRFGRAEVQAHPALGQGAARPGHSARTSSSAASDQPHGRRHHGRRSPCSATCRATASSKTAPCRCCIRRRMMLEESHLLRYRLPRAGSMGCAQGRHGASGIEMLDRIEAPPGRRSRSRWSANTSGCTTHTSRLRKRCSHAGYENGVLVSISTGWIPEEINDSDRGQAAGRVADGVHPARRLWRPGGMEGMICRLPITRATQGIPYFGICLGMQIAVIELCPPRAGLCRR